MFFNERRDTASNFGGTSRIARRRSAFVLTLIAGCFLHIDGSRLSQPVFAEEAVGTDEGGSNTGQPYSEVGALIPLHGEITDITVSTMKRRIDEAVENGATVIVFSMDTPGGLVSSGIAI
ncbi:MAG: hypothetical protein ACPGXK_10665, partial [Phycisphaerae bacterium]